MTESNVPPTTAAPAPPAAVGSAPLATTGTAYPAPYAGPEPDASARTMGMLCHLSLLSGFIIPFGTIIGPILVWTLKKKDHPFIDDQGKEALNFSITFLIALIISVVLIAVFIGLILAPAVGITGLVFIIMGSMKANKGIAYRYPFALRFIK
jgi:uncharacterized Tic20 family protein